MFHEIILYRISKYDQTNAIVIYIFHTLYVIVRLCCTGTRWQMRDRELPHRDDSDSSLGTRRLLGTVTKTQLPMRLRVWETV